MAHPLEVILPALIATIIVIAVAIAATLALRRTTISIIIRKDPDMATIKERLATLEADNTALKAEVAQLTSDNETLKAQVADHGATLGTTPTADELTIVRNSVDAVAERVSDVEAEIGADPAPAEATTPAPPAPAVDPALGIVG